MKTIFGLFALVLLSLSPVTGWSAAGGPAARSAPHLVNPSKAPILAATRAGKRIVAVGDYGFVILSDDGKVFRQATTAPTRAALTSVYFADDKQGWAAGHDGTIIATGDGGETWRVLRETRGKDQVLLAIWFETPQHGFAVGQFGLTVETDDGGATWRERRLIEEGDAADRHLLGIVPVGDGVVLVAAESGGIFRSVDNGGNWKFIQTENKGSFWTGIALGDGVVLMAGMRGHIYRSVDGGALWKKVPAATQQSLTAAVRRGNGGVRLVGMAGVSLTSQDKGASFEAAVRPDRAGLTAVADGPDGEVIFSLLGVVSSGK